MVPTHREQPPFGAATARPIAGHFTVVDYRGGGAASPVGVVALLGTGVPAAIALGFAVHWVAQWLYLALLFPLLMGLLLGALGTALVKRLHVRSVATVAVIGALIGSSAMGAMHYAGYLELRGIATQLATTELADVLKLPAKQRQEALSGLDGTERTQAEEALSILAVHDFAGYLDHRARQGVELTSTHSTGRGLNLGYVGTIIYWLAELSAAVIVVIMMLTDAARQPFCRECGGWKAQKFVGSLRAPDAEAVAHVRSGDLQRIASAGASAAPGTNRVTLHACSKCAPRGTVEVTVESVRTGNDGSPRTSTLARVSYPAEASAALEQLFGTAPAPSFTTQRIG